MAEDNLPRLTWRRTNMGEWYEATWDGAGTHDHANVIKDGGLTSDRPQWRWQVTIDMESTVGYARTKQDAADKATEVWRERWKP